MTHDQQQSGGRSRGAAVSGTVRRRWLRAAPVGLLLLVAACGGDAMSPAGESASSPASGSVSPLPSTSATTTGGGGAASSELIGSVGEGDAFVIALKDSSGAEVTSLPAGTYTVKVKDVSAIHNFHLTGPGVDEKTTVAEKTDATWTVTLTAGKYTFVCDPHPNMTGSFTVT